MDDFTVVSSAVIKKVASQGASVAVDVKVGASAYHNGATQATTTSYVRYSRTDALNPVSSEEWTLSDIDGLILGTRCVDCTPNNRVTQMQAKVDALYSPEYALEVRFTWSAVPLVGEAWSLVVECTRLSPGSESVLVQVGQGGANPSQWTTAYTCTSDSDAMFDTYDLTAAELNGGAPVVRLWDAQADEPDDTAQGTFGLDMVRIIVRAGPESPQSWNGEVPLPGNVTALYASPANESVISANSTRNPALVSGSGTFSYGTAHGNYTFSNSTPYYFTYVSLGESIEILQGGFFVSADQGLNVNSYSILERSPAILRVDYGLASGALTQGTISLTVLFDDEAAPEFAATFTLSPNATITTYRLEFRQITTGTFLRSSFGTASDFSGYQTPQPISQPSPSAEIGPDAYPRTWDHWSVSDWQGTSGSLLVGPVALPGGESGPGAVIDFGAQSISGSARVTSMSVRAYGTAWTLQEKVFFASEHYWQFYLDGSGVYYRVSKGIPSRVTETDVSSVSDWSTPRAVPTGGPNADFAVDVRGRQVAVVYEWGNNQINFVKGTIHGDWIDWEARNTVVVIFSFAPPLSVAIGARGDYWVAVQYSQGGATGRREVFYSPDGLLWISSIWWTDSTGDPSRAMKLVPLPRGEVAVLTATSGSSDLQWYRFTVAGWTGPFQPGPGSAMGMEASSGHTIRMTWSTASIDETIGVVYRHSSGGIYHTVITGSTNSVPVQVGPGPGVFPAVQLDDAGEAHAFWVSESDSKIWYSRRSGGAWSAPTAPFTLGYTPYWLTTSDRTSNFAFVGWTWETKMRTSNPLRIGFGSLPASAPYGGLPVQPWEARGLSPHAHFFPQMAESVNPATGQLIVRQTDLALPGRGLDLEISRVYRPPDVFLAGQPYGYEASPYADMGRGWFLDLPWLGTSYVHLAGGQQVRYDWQGGPSGSIFEHHGSVHFVLRQIPCETRPETVCSYTLTMKSGLRYTFDATRKVTRVEDSTGLNALVFGYSGGRLNQVTDSIGRQTSVFDYYPSGKLRSVTYGGLTFNALYDAAEELLVSVQVSDAANPATSRVTEYEYCISVADCGSHEGWLLRRVTYDTGARATYFYTSARVGTAAYTYLVTRQTLEETSSGPVVKSTRFDYEVVNGHVVFSQATQYSYGENEEGASSFDYDFLRGLVTTWVQTAAGQTPMRLRTWFGEAGVEQVDGHPGGTLHPAFATRLSYDDWGNVIYASGPEGEETFASYANTRTRNAFVRPAALDQTSSTLLMHEDFADRDVADWKTNPSDPVRSDPWSFLASAPSMRVGPSTTAPVVARRPFTDTGSLSAFVSVPVKLGETTEDHEVQLFAADGATGRLRVNFNSMGKIVYWDGSGWRNACTGAGCQVSYGANRWYRVHVAAFTSTNTFELWLDDVPLVFGASMYQSGDLDTMRFEVSVGGSLWVDDVSVTTTSQITITDLAPGQRVALVSLAGSTGSTVREATASQLGSAAFAWPLGSWPHLALATYTQEGLVELLAPRREVFAGDTYEYRPPSTMTAISRVPGETGWLRYVGAPLPWVGDDVPLGAIELAEDCGYTGDGSPTEWCWGDTGWVLQGAGYHYSNSWWNQWAGTIHHYFQDAPPGSQLTVPPGEYHVQYVYIMPGLSPAEIMLEFCRGGASCWTRAFWGVSDVIGQPATAMQGIPEAEGRWLMLVVKSDDIETAGAQVHGAAFTHFAGQLLWDVTARGDSRTGGVTVRGLSLNQRVMVYREDGTNIGDGTMTSGNELLVSVYGTGGIGASVFPLSGYFEVYKADGSLEYLSSVFDNITGGDVWQYSPMPFYASTPNADIHDRPVGIRTWQDGFQQGRLTESYAQYDAAGLARETKSARGGGWDVSAFTYDTFGFGMMKTASVPKYGGGSHVISMMYWGEEQGDPATCALAYPKRVEETVSGVPFKREFVFDCSLGRLTSEGNWRASNEPLYETTYTYDVWGRITQLQHPPDSGGVRGIARYEYDDGLRTVTVRDETWDGITRKQKVVVQFDGLGHEQSTRWYSFDGQTLVRWTKLTYNWQGLVETHRTGEGHVFRVEYDFLGRPTRWTVPDPEMGETCAIATYSDATNERTVRVDREGSNVCDPELDVAWHATTYRHDWSGRLVQVSQQVPAGSPVVSSNSYDKAGNLRSVTDPMGFITTHTYDEAGNLDVTTYPDTTTENYDHDGAGNLVQKVDRLGRALTFAYDERGQPTFVYLSGAEIASYTYDSEGNTKTARTREDGVEVTSLTLGYDLRSRVTSESSSFTFRGMEASFLTGYDYDLSGNVLRIDYPAGSPYPSVHYRYDALGRLCAIGSVSPSACTPVSDFFAKFTYDGNDGIREIADGNGVRTTYTSDHAGRATEIDVCGVPCTSEYNTYDLGPSAVSAEEWSSSGCAGVCAVRDPNHSEGDGDQTFAVATLDGKTNLYALDDLPALGPTDTIEYVEVRAWAKWYVDKGSSPTLRLLVKLGPSECSGPVKTLSSSYAEYSTRWNTKCGGSSSWTKPDVDGLVAGFRSGCQSGNPCEIRVTKVVVEVAVTTPSGGTLLHLEYDYDSLSNLLRGDTVIDGQSFVETYGYDALSRLTNSDATGLWGSLSYTYDDNGNRQTEARSGVTLYEYDFESGSPNPYNRLLTVTPPSAPSTDFTYDLDGTLKRRVQGVDDWTYTYNVDGRLTKIATTAAQVVLAEHRYDGLGRRVGTYDGSSTRGFAFLGISPLVEKDLVGGSISQYIHGAGMLIAKIDPGGNSRYFHADRLGSTRLVTDPVGAQIFSGTYEPFGRLARECDGGSCAFNPRVRFAGEWQDENAADDLYYLYSRYYDPNLGRFVSEDSVLGSLSGPQTLNRYAYVVNNPLKYTDPTGEAIFLLALIPILILLGLVLMAPPVGDGSGHPHSTGHSAEGLEEAYWTGVSVMPGIETLGDLWFVNRDCGRAWDNPTGGNVGTCVFDIGVAILPFAGVGLVKVGGRILGKVPIGRADDLPMLGGAASFFNRMDDLAPPRGRWVVQSGRIGDNGIPNSIAHRVDNGGNLISVGYFDEIGEATRRIDVAPHATPHRWTPHVHYYTWLEYGGRRWPSVSKERPLSMAEQLLWGTYL